jgi:hypothetical protein
MPAARVLRVWEAANRPPPGTAGAFRTSEGWVESAPPGTGDARSALSRVELLCADTGYRRTTTGRTGRSSQATVPRSDMADSAHRRANPRRYLCRQRPVPAGERPLWPREPRQRLLWRCATSHPATSDKQSYSRANLESWPLSSCAASLCSDQPEAAGGTFEVVESEADWKSPVGPGSRSDAVAPIVGSPLRYRR